MYASQAARFPAGARAWIAILAALAAAACGEDVTAPDGEGVLGEWVRSAGIERTYELRLPPSYDETQPTPLLIALHGNPDTGAGLEARSGLTPAADAAGFITAYPDGIDYTWDIRDVLLVLNLTKHLSDYLNIDLDRVYVAGYSAGGTTTQQVACALYDVVAAAASIGATLRSDISTACRLPRAVPILFVHGTEDQAFPWDGLDSGTLQRLSVRATLERWTELDRCVGEPVVDTLPDLYDDGTRVWSERWSQCASGAEVMLYGVEGGGHTWPGGPGPFPPGRVTQEISSAEILEFLQRHTLRGS
jgi:polyhydroxybutyrate depolymerase